MEFASNYFSIDGYQVSMLVILRNAFPAELLASVVIRRLNDGIFDSTAHIVDMQKENTLMKKLSDLDSKGLVTKRRDFYHGRGQKAFYTITERGKYALQLIYNVKKPSMSEGSQ